MKIQNERLLRLALVGAMSCLVSSPGLVRADEEWEQNTPYYEDDAWYDVTEWFDGNDYNPSDESVGVIDNETYDIASETGDDGDNDWGNSLYRDDDEYGYDYDDPYDDDASSFSWYGYNDAYDDDDWFYDYYDDGYGYYYGNNDGAYEYTTRYYDLDNDGAYDAYSTYSDTDGDGLYDNYSYYAFNDVGDSREGQRQAKKQASKNAEQKKASGEVTRVKRVAVQDTKHLVVQVTQDGGQTVNVDLGPANKLHDFDIEKGDRVTANGPMTKVGDKQLLIARNLQANNHSAKINREGRKFSGKIDGMRTVSGHGQQNRIVSLKGKSGKRRMVDVGPKNKLDTDLEKGDQISVKGPIVKINDHSVVLAQTLNHDGNKVQIDRRTTQSSNRNN